MSDAPSLNGRRFASRNEAIDGDVGSATIFDDHEEGDLVWASYFGGAVRLGYLVGTRANDSLEFRYVHSSIDGRSEGGYCQSCVKVGGTGQLELHERWRWESRAGAGTSILYEVPENVDP